MEMERTSIPKREIITEEQLKEELGNAVKTVLEPWIKENEMNFASVILASMHVIEQYASQTKGLSSADKLKYALDLIPQIIDFGINNGKLTPEEGDSLKKKIAIGTDVVKQLIGVYILISKNPTFIQYHEEMHEIFEKKFGCCGPSFHKKK